MNKTNKPDGRDKVWDIIFNALGLVCAFAGFIAVLFVGVFLAAASVYMAFRSFTLESGGKIAAGFFFGLLMLGVSLVMAYADILIIKSVANKFITGDKDTAIADNNPVSDTAAADKEEGDNK